MAYGGEPIYDEDGFDDDGFDEEGFDGDGYKRKEYDSDGFNPAGIDYDGYNRSGLDWRGFDRDGNHHATTTSLFPEEKGIYIAGYESARHLWKELKKYFPNIDARGKREINLGENQNGEFTIGLTHGTSRVFKLFSASVGDDFIVNKNIPKRIKKILGIPEEEKRTYKYRKNVKNEEIDKLKKEIEMLKIKNENDIESFLGYKKEVEQWGEDKNRQIEQIRLRQTGAGEKSEGGEGEIIRLKVEIKNMTDQIRYREEMINKKMMKTIGGDN